MRQDERPAAIVVPAMPPQDPPPSRPAAIASPGSSSTTVWPRSTSSRVLLSLYLNYRVTDLYVQAVASNADSAQLLADFTRSSSSRPRSTPRATTCSRRAIPGRIPTQANRHAHPRRAPGSPPEGPRGERPRHRDALPCSRGSTQSRPAWARWRRRRTRSWSASRRTATTPRGTWRPWTASTRGSSRTCESSGSASATPARRGPFGLWRPSPPRRA